jgi:hypothetical protein
MSVMVTLPRGFGGLHHYVPQPRIVVEQLTGAIRLHKAKTATEALAVREAWRQNDYSTWPGEVRLFEERPCQQTST